MTANAIIQARCGSSRFPNKIFADIDGKPLIWHVINRLSYAKKINKVIVATTTNSKDDILVNWCESNGIDYYRGSEDNVLNRYYMASLNYPSDIIVRITADDPFKEPRVINDVINKLIEENLDIVTNNFPSPSFPEGLDCEALTFNTLAKAEAYVTDNFEKEHVTQYMYRNPTLFKIGNVRNHTDLSKLRWTIDTLADYEMVKAIYNHRNSCNKGILLMSEIIDILRQHPEIQNINSNVERSEMYK